MTSSVLTGPSRDMPNQQSTLLSEIAHQCSLRPHSVAVSQLDRQVTYSQLSRQASKISRALRAAGVQTGDLVPILTGGGAGMIAAMLGIWATEAAFVPLDISSSSTKIQLALNCIKGHRILLVDEPQLALHDWKCIAISSVLSTSDEGELSLLSGPSPENLAYGFFTSGSTGLPKCCLNVHRGLLNRVLTMRRMFELKPGEAVLQNSSHIFDSSLWQIFWPLSIGAEIVIPVRKSILDFEATLEQMSNRAVRMTDFVPSVLEKLVDLISHSDKFLAFLSGLRSLLIGGEALNIHLVSSLRRLLPHVQLVNTYGPTEASIGMVFHLFTGDELVVPLGLPIDNCGLAVVDKNMEPVPRGAVGEIVIGGACIGLGYLDDPERTAVAFLRNTKLPIGSDTVYRTGDLGHIGQDGLLYFNGRNDDQVKIGGVRIEIGEIEYHLRKYANILQCKVVPVVEEHRTWLAGFYSSAGDIDAFKLRKFLSKSLGNVSTPHLLKQIREFPLTTSGKIDSRALVSTHCRNNVQKTRNFTGDVLVDKLMEVARRALPGQTFGADDDLFELGLDSLGALSLVMEAEKLRKCKIRLEDFGARPTLKNLSCCQENDPLETEDQTMLIDVSRLTGPVSFGKSVSGDTLLLTGATGYVGRALVGALLEFGSMPIVCAIRAQSDSVAYQRLLSLFGNKEIPKRVSAIAVDFSSDDWVRKIPGQVGCIVHAAAEVNFSKSYAQLRTTNCESTATLCRFACETGSAFHHVSSAAVLHRSPHGSGTILGPAKHPADLETGYARSKWVAERTVFAYEKIGLRSEVYRLGEMAPDLLFPYFNESSTLTILAKASIEVGSLPDIGGLTDCTPTGLVAQWIAKRCLLEGKSLQSAHLLAHPTRLPVREILVKMTGNLPITSIADFSDKLVQNQSLKVNPVLARAQMVLRSASNMETPGYTVEPSQLRQTLDGDLPRWPLIDSDYLKQTLGEFRNDR